MQEIDISSEDKFDPGDEIQENDLLKVSNKQEEPELQAQEFSEDRAKIMNKIRLYKEVFPSSCALVDISSLKYMNEEELEEYLYNIRLVVSNRNSNSLVQSSIDGAIQGIETIGGIYFPKLRGLHSDLNAMQAYKDCLAEIAIERANIGYVPPEYRLIMLIGTCAASRLAQPDLTQITPDEEKKYENL